MPIAHYMRFVSGDRNLPDKIGGLPSHLPMPYPVCASCRCELEFLAQFYCTEERLHLPGVLCLQLYGCADASCGPWPTAIALPKTARVNSANEGIGCRCITCFGIEWEIRTDPDVAPDLTDDATLALFGSKVAGFCMFSGVLEAQDRYLLQLREQPAGCNFGGYNCVVYLDSEMNVRTELA